MQRETIFLNRLEPSHTNTFPNPVYMKKIVGLPSTTTTTYSIDTADDVKSFDLISLQFPCNLHKKKALVGLICLYFIPAVR